jgi:hypothetical protein
MQLQIGDEVRCDGHGDTYLGVIIDISNEVKVQWLTNNTSWNNQIGNYREQNFNHGWLISKRPQPKLSVEEQVIQKIIYLYAKQERKQHHAIV